MNVVPKQLLDVERPTESRAMVKNVLILIMYYIHLSLIRLGSLWFVHLHIKYFEKSSFIS